MAILIRRDGSVHVRVPLRTSRTAIESFVNSRIVWITKHLSAVKSRHDKEKKEYHDGEVHYYMGNPVTLKVLSSKRNRVSFDGNFIILECTPDINPDKAGKMINDLYRGLAKDVFSARMEALMANHPDYGFRPSGLKVRTMVSRWGSCSSGGTITLSSNLLKKRVELIDYVILHELCHLIHRNHGPGFYRLLSMVCPEYKGLQRELKSPVTY